MISLSNERSTHPLDVRLQMADIRQIQNMNVVMTVDDKKR